MRALRYVEAIARLLLRAPRKGSAWPPGSLNPFDSTGKRQQSYLLKLAALHGSIFKQWMYGRHTTCVVGHAQGSRLLRAGQSMMTSVTMDQTSLYPGGNLRQMQGETHRHHRRRLGEALNAGAAPDNLAANRQAIFYRLTMLRNGHGDIAVGSAELRRGLHQMATDCLLLTAFGIAPGAPEHALLSAAYDRLGLQSPANHVDPKVRAAFGEITAILGRVTARLEAHAELPHPSWLAHLVATHQLDQTLLGNLVFIIETVRFDLASLWRWILYYLAQNPEVLGRVRNDSGAYSLAIVQETLRLNQSEYLLRQVAEPFTFEGYAIPKDSRVRVCVWEGHKDPDNFPEPFIFRPERFLGSSYTINQYAPFGLDKHRCLGADFAVELSQLFVETLAHGFDLEGANVGPPAKGKHHWEPNPDFTVGLKPVNTAPSNEAIGELAKQETRP